MAVSGNSQAMIAAFVFGIVVTVASGALFLIVKNAGSSLFRDGLRLVLVIFLASSAFWAIVQLITTLVDFNSLSGCQAVIAVASAFDQLARVSLEQSLLWGIKGELSLSIGTFLPQSIIVLRFILGGVFVGVQRPQFSPVCVTTTLIAPLGIVVLVTDAFVVLMLFTRACAAGYLKQVGQGAQASTRSKSLLLLMGGFGVWTALSTPMILGIKTFEFATRTIPPAIGILVAIGLVIMFKNSLDFPLSVVAELDSDDDRWRVVNSPRNASAHDTRTRGQANSGPAFSQAYEKSTEDANLGAASATRPQMLSRDRDLPIISRPSPGQAEAGVGGAPVQGQLFPPTRSQTAPVVLQKATKAPPKSSYGKKGRLLISNPVLSDNDEHNPLKKVATIDLITAAQIDKDRRDRFPLAQISETTPRVAPSPPAISAEQMMKRSQILSRKQVGAASTANSIQAKSAETGPKHLEAATTTSAQLSPGREEVRRRSPRMPSENFQPVSRASSAPSKTQVDTVRKTALQPHVATMLLQPPVRSPKRPYTTAPNLAQQKNALPNVSRSPSGVSERRRGSGAASPRRARSTRVFTDPNAPPALPPTIPIRHPERLSSQPRHSEVPLVAPLRLPRKGLSQQDGGVVSPRRNASLKAGDRRPQNATMKAGSKSTAKLTSNSMADFTTNWVGEQGMPQQQRIMFIDSIEYNNPDVVQTIMSATTDKTPGFTPRTMLSERDSVVNRPRPIPRYSSISHSTFPSEEPVNFGSVKYSPSGISTGTNRRVVFSTPTSPNERMELAPLPKTAGIFPESKPGIATKIVAKPEADFPGADGAEWKSDQPGPLVAGFGEAGGPKSPSSLDAGHEEVAKGTASRFSADQSSPVASRYMSKFSIDTSYSSIEEPQSGLSRFSVYDNVSYEGSKRQSSPIIPIEGMLSPPLSDDDGSNCGSVQSPVDARASGNAKFRTSVSASNNAATPKTSYVDPTPMFATENDGKETMTVMLDPRTQHDLEAHEVVARGVSSEQDVHVKRARWHRRVGEECPTFSDRKMRTVPRKVFRPASLQLNRPVKMTTIVETEPSPCESPSFALNRIREQLDNLDALDEESSPSPSPTSSTGLHRMSLLANLEAEMGMQESHWQQMRRDLSQGSPSASQNSTMTTPRHEGLASSPVAHRSERSSGITNWVSRHSISRDSEREREHEQEQEQEQNSSRSRDSNNGDMRNWSAANGPIYKHASTTWRGPERETEGAHRRPRHSGSAVSKTHLLSVTRRTMASLSSPTPPDTDESGSDGDSEIEYEFKAGKSTDGESGAGAVKHSALWRPVLTTPDLAVGSSNPLWTPNAEACAPPPEPEPEATAISSLGLRPLARKSSDPLHIESSELWSKSENFVNSKSAASTIGGLWETASASFIHLPSPSPEPVARPRTQKPPRRSRRVSTLPDILESPEPLLNKRGTLGIYQFPWGEKSDTATPQPHVRLFTPMPGTMSSRGNSAAYSTPVPRSRTLESQGYPPGLFDHYDDENGGDNFAEYTDGSDVTEDDDFDETTLWEIASLLRSDEVPSRGSLLSSFPMEEEPFTPVTASDIPQHTRQENDRSSDLSNSIGLDTSPLPSSPKRATLWIKDDSAPLVGENKTAPHRQDAMWQSYLDKSSNFVRGPTRPSLPVPITSSALWTLKPKPADVVNADQLWNGRASYEPDEAAVASFDGKTSKAPEVAARKLLWQPPIPIVTSPKGLSQPDSHLWSSYLIPKDLNAQAKYRVATPALVESSSLWTLSEPKRPFLQRPGMLWYSMAQETRRDIKSEAASIQPVHGAKQAVNADVEAVNHRLWSPPVKVQYEELDGLFSANHKRADFRRTTNKPASLSLRPVARKQEGALQISSSHLWSQPSDHSFTQDWITLSSMRPGSPGATSSSGTESLQSDASSLNSGATGLSTLGSMHANYAKHFVSRFTATPEQWDAALQTAIQASQPAAPVIRTEVQMDEKSASSQTNTNDQISSKASPSRLSPIWQRLWSRTT